MAQENDLANATMQDLPKPLVSVIMPVYNAARYLEESIEGVLNQCYPHFELIIIDDGSTDNSWQIIQSCASRDSRVKAHRQEHAGLSRTRNAAMACARGKFLANNDADDISNPLRLERQVRYLRTHSECVALGSRVLWVDDDGDPIHSPKTYPDHERIERVLLTGIASVLQHSGVMFRADAVRAVGGYCEDLCVSEDLDLYLRLTDRGGRFANLREVLLTVHVHSTSTSAMCAKNEGERARRLAITRSLDRRGVPSDEVKLVPIPTRKTLESNYLIWCRLACNNGYFRTSLKYAWRSLCESNRRLECIRHISQIASGFALRRTTKTGKRLRRKIAARIRKLLPSLKSAFSTV